MSLFSFLFKQNDKDYILPERPLDPKFIVNEENRAEYRKKGYTIIKNAVDNESIDMILETHKAISQLPEFKTEDKLTTSTDFGETSHKMAADTVQKISGKILDGHVDKDLCKYDLGGCIIIKNKGSWLEPHQDCSIVDEYKNVTTYVWIPTVDSNKENGTFCAIPGSHKWAAWPRSSQRLDWPLYKFRHFLWEQEEMQAIEVKKGDILLFDSALIHGSGENNSGDIRVAFNISIFEKNAGQCQFVKDKKTPKGKVEKFMVDESYWYDGDFWGRPKKYESTELIDQKYPTKITKEFLREQITKYYPK